MKRFLCDAAFILGLSVLTLVGYGVYLSFQNRNENIQQQIKLDRLCAVVGTVCAGVLPPQQPQARP